MLLVKHYIAQGGLLTFREHRWSLGRYLGQYKGQDISHRISDGYWSFIKVIGFFRPLTVPLNVVCT